MRCYSINDRKYGLPKKGGGRTAPIPYTYRCCEGNNIKFLFNNCIIIFFLILITNFINCSQLSIKEEKDDFGRVLRSVSYIDGDPDEISLIRYIGKTNKPLSKEHIRLKDGAPIQNWTEVFTYNKGRVSRERFFLNIKKKNIKSGEINYFYTGEKPSRTEYYSIININKNVVFRHGLDLYKYTAGLIKNRRIIEYEQNKQTKHIMQVSQYVIHYGNDKIKSMQTWMLDKKSKKIINKKESNKKIITEMIKNIEKSLKDRCIGFKYFRSKKNVKEK